MRYKLLGRSGLRVSPIALGTMTFGSGAEWSRSEGDCRSVFDAYAEAGGNFVDTANIYMQGESEKIVGRLVAGNRDHFVVATKYANAFPGANNPNAAGMHRKSLTQSLDASLKRLALDYVDLYYVHWWDFTAPVEEVQRALEDAVRAGKILHVGLSDAPAWVVSRAQAFSDLRGLSPIAAMQLEYSPVERSIEREHLPLARSHDIAVTAWSPLAGGILTGKYTSQLGGDAPRRMDSMQLQPLDARNTAIAEKLDELAARMGARPSQIALAWSIANGAIPVVGATSAGQMRENMESVDLVLDQDALCEIDSVSSLHWGHPYNMPARDDVMALGYGGMLDAIDIPDFPIRRRPGLA